MKILHVNANPKPLDESASKQITDAFFATLASTDADLEITHRDLTVDAPPFYSYEHYRNFWYPVGDAQYKPSEEEAKQSEYARREIERFNKTDVLVITTPMWNFGVPATLKAWIDQVLAPKHAFSLGPSGVKALHNVKKVVVLLASGGAYPDGDPVTMQLKMVFGFVGISDVQFAWADGQNPVFFTDSDERLKKARKAAVSLALEITAQANGIPAAQA
ncbi:MAG: NAD(P)H-dependent oxidoreductase [Candidatus Lernaella stagnicola]|nr:NAD(P)H-dependent oxidoreductase [Candidatus Lernaella stagnicola]